MKTEIVGSGEFIEWVEAFQDSMLHEAEPVSAVDFNVTNLLDYAREMGLSEAEIQKSLGRWIREGYLRAHKRAIRRLRSAVCGDCRYEIESAFADVLESGLKLGLSKEKIEREYVLPDREQE